MVFWQAVTVSAASIAAGLLLVSLVIGVPPARRAAAAPTTQLLRTK